MKILNTIPNVSPKAREILSQIGTVEDTSCTQQELADVLKDYDAAFIGLGLNFDADALAHAENVKAIATATTGLDHIDTVVAKQRGIEVLSLKSETAFLETITGTAELGWGLLLDLLRHISHSFASVKEYEWDRERFKGNELRGKTLGIIGLGRLGKMTAQYSKAFHMNVIAHDPHVDPNVFTELGVESVSLDDLYSRSDVVSVHVHLNEKTEGMIGKDQFEKMKDSAVLVNTARGKIVNEADVLEALENKAIAGYATDVLANELDFAESFSNHPLVEYAKNHSNCIITPHTGGMTYESREATDVFMAEKLIAFLKSA